jgi:hypothetical protein
MSTAATKAGDTISAPQKTGVHKPQQFSVTISPAEHAVWSSLSPVPTGSFMVNVKAITANIRFWFKAATDASVGITSSTGYYLAAGACEPFWVNASLLAAIETVGSTSGTLEITISSPLFSVAGSTVLP